MKAPALIRALTVALAQSMNVLVKGSPGIGKSDILASAVAALNWDLLICHPVVEEPTDSKGLPAIVGGKAEFLPYGNLRQMIEAKRELVVLIDDIGQAAPSVQASYMQLLLARQIDGKAISKHVRFVAATNSRKDNAGVNGLLTPLLSRFALIAELEADADSWCAWALANSVPVELVAFIRFRPDMICATTMTREIQNFHCPRTIVALGKWLAAGVTDYEVWAGAVGPAFAVEFKAFYETYKALAGLPAQIVLDPQNARLLDKAADRYALCGALAHIATRKNFTSLATYGKRLPAEFGTLLMRDITIRHPALLQSDEYVDWITRNPDSVR